MVDSDKWNSDAILHFTASRWQHYPELQAANIVHFPVVSVIRYCTSLQSEIAWNIIDLLPHASILTKVLKSMLYTKLELYVYSTDNQSGFKKQHAFDKCIYALKEI